MTDDQPRPAPAPTAGSGPDTVVATGLDDALARLVDLDDLATADHVGVLEAVHDALVAELARTED